MEDPNIIKIAKLALIIADKNTPFEDKNMCVKLSVKQGVITSDDGYHLLQNTAELEDFI